MATYTECPPNFFDRAILMGAATAHPFPAPPALPVPEDTTHRFYRCTQILVKSPFLECTQVLKRDALAVSESMILTIKKGCPKVYDPLTISWKTGTAVRIIPSG